MNNHAVPFEVRDAPLRQYCEVHFSGHDHYRSIELQRLEISPSRSGYVVLLNTNDGHMDVLSEPALEIDETWCRNDPSVSSYRLGKIEPIELESVHMNTGSDGVDAHVVFNDSAGRRVEMTVRSPEKRPAKSRKLFIPAVPRASAKMLWFLYVFEFGPLRQSDHIDVRIDDRPMPYKKWPWPLGFRRHVQGRYANDIAFLSLNPPVLGTAQTVDAQNGFELSDSASSEDGSTPRIRSQRMKLHGGHALTVRFEPPIPTISPSAASDDEKGQFSVLIDEIRISRGNYEIRSENDQTSVRLTDVDQWWNPPQKDLSVWMLQFYHRLRTRGKRWNWIGRFRATDAGVTCEGDWTLQPTKD